VQDHPEGCVNSLGIVTWPLVPGATPSRADAVTRRSVPLPGKSQFEIVTAQAALAIDESRMIRMGKTCAHCDLAGVTGPGQVTPAQSQQKIQTVFQRGDIR